MMKRLMYFILMIAVLSTTYSFYGCTGASVRTYNTIPNDSERVVQSGYGAQVNLYKDNHYFYLSGDKNPVRFGGQRGQDVTLVSAGAGTELDLGRGFKLGFDLGWYHPIHDTDRDAWPETQLAEGLGYYLNNKLGLSRYWDEYWIKYHGAIGGKVNIGYSTALSENWTFGGSLAYRYLKLGEMVKGADRGKTDGWWEYKEDRDFGGAQVGLGFTYKF